MDGLHLFRIWGDTISQEYEPKEGEGALAELTFIWMECEATVVKSSLHSIQGFPIYHDFITDVNGSWYVLNSLTDQILKDVTR